jgi:hypothetical protein
MTWRKMTCRKMTRRKGDAGPGKCGRFFKPQQVPCPVLRSRLARSFEPATIRPMDATKAELIECHDCGGAVSFRAANCPHCGSAEPAGPYVFNRKEARRHRIEERNDRNLVVVTLSCGLVGGSMVRPVAPARLALFWPGLAMARSVCWSEFPSRLPSTSPAIWSDSRGRAIRHESRRRQASTKTCAPVTISASAVFSLQ